MLNPIVIPLPVGLILVALLAVALWAVERYLETAELPFAWDKPTTKPTGRHRPEAIPAEDRVDWATLTARRLNALEAEAFALPEGWNRIPVIAGHDDHEPTADPIDHDRDIRVMAAEEALGTDTRELEAVQ